jgi:regulator of protease activity HflC (stomatin/prohibitin superfamily)
VDIPGEIYFTADRVRISFKTTIRGAVTNAAALFDQGPGTYLPFTRDATQAEEANVALRGLVQNSIRETVQAMRIDEVLFGGRTELQPALRERIRAGLSQTAQRWGLGIVEVWLTEVDVDDHGVRQAMQSEVKEKMEGKGRLAAWEAQVQKGGLFNEVALQMSERARKEGRDLPLEEARSFLLSFYQNERALEVATKAAGGQNDLMSFFYMQYFGLPVPNQSLPGAGFQRAPVGSLRAAPSPSPGGAQEGVFILGREGDIIVEGDGVSRHHARLVVESGRMTLIDLGSTNGTFVSGRKLTPQEATPVGSGDNVGLGNTVAVTGLQLAAATQTRILRPSAVTQSG